MSISAQPSSDRWTLENEHAIVWDVAGDERLPHEDHVEMSGRHVSLIVHFGADAHGCLTLCREVIWPVLRMAPDDVRGYLRREYDDEVAPNITVDGAPWLPGPLARIRFDGVLTFEHQPTNGVAVIRTLLPSTERPKVYERWVLRVEGPKAHKIEVTPYELVERDHGMYGEYVLNTRLDALPPAQTLEPGQTMEFGVVIRAARDTLSAQVASAESEERKRRAFVTGIMHALRLETPDPVLNSAFDFAKLRASESVFATKRGLFHSPGGGRYYGGIWANDQAEYANPFFPFLGEPVSNEASLNAYRVFASAMTPDYQMIPSSFEMEGDIPFHAGGDRGDAAMVAYGAARFALARGDRVIAEELWPEIVWCLEYCRRKTHPDGVVESDTDELEGRFATGKANLSTSSLCYGALRSAADLGRALGKDAEAAEFDTRADALDSAIERYFGAEVEGFETYRYYDGNDVLRSWICLPLCMGILERKEGTVAALFSPRLWSPDGLATQAGDTTFWDRSTLYALRGVFAAGETETALQHLTVYTRRRLLGEHVPYPVEASPEGGQAHLSAESALYCRVFTEGLFGITPIGLRSFRCLPRLPQKWPLMRLHDARAFGSHFDVAVKRVPKGIELTVTAKGMPAFRETRPQGQSFEVRIGQPAGAPKQAAVDRSGM